MSSNRLSWRGTGRNCRKGTFERRNDACWKDEQHGGCSLVNSGTQCREAAAFCHATLGDRIPFRMDVGITAYRRIRCCVRFIYPNDNSIFNALSFRLRLMTVANASPIDDSSRFRQNSCVKRPCTRVFAERSTDFRGNESMWMGDV